jgi:hypothetical protein
MTHKGCIHFWVIDSDGRRGKCKYCNLVRIYPAFSDMTKTETEELRRKAHQEVKEAASAAPSIAESGQVPGRSNRRVNSEARMALMIRASKRG